MKTKRCTGCEEVKPISEFHKCKATKDGLAYECKLCKQGRRRKYYKENRERARENNRRWQNNNREKVREMNRVWQKNNREKFLESNRRWREANRNQVSRQYTRRMGEINSRSLELAHRSGLPWEDWEDEFILSDNGLTNYQKTVKLGRSLYSLSARKTYLRKKAKNELTNDNVRV